MAVSSVGILLYILHCHSSSLADGSVSILFSICLLCGGQKAFLKSQIKCTFPLMRASKYSPVPSGKKKRVSLSYFSMSLSSPLSLSFIRVFLSFKQPTFMSFFPFLFLVTLPEFFNLEFRYPSLLVIRDYIRSLSSLLPPYSRVIHTYVCPVLARRQHEYAFFVMLGVNKTSLEK